MFTVLVKFGSYREDLHVADRVVFRRRLQADEPCEVGYEPGLRLEHNDGSALHIPVGEFQPPGSEAFVMNEYGATVARYLL